ncbi:Nodulation protein S (NodS) [Rhodococcus triatomae]|uniref:Nodulation protein S (NodS) n=2 Tax=Rhodococcus triatomae TaxID=300028 RepID=A0A1G8B5K7_9NOCA|nr:Nodulation protein S (NodS) [Rhodococcus triatomae]
MTEMDGDFFESMYADAEDPWGFAERWYEERKYALTLAALPRRRYRCAFEPGGSVGVFTEMLARRCDRVVATDIVARALDTSAARLRRAGLADRVELRQSSLLATWPVERFDLIVLGEVLYYLDAEGLRTVAARAVDALEDGGTLIAVHWTHRVPDYPSTGTRVHDELARTPGLVPFASYADGDFRLDVLTRGAVPSVAAEEGLVSRPDSGAS